MKRSKQVLALALSAAMMLTAVMPAYAAEDNTVVTTSTPVATESTATYNVTKYPDVNEFYANAVNKLSVLNIVSGDDKGNFNPSKSLTRAEAAKIVVNMVGVGAANSNATSRFTDVEAGKWYAGYIAQADSLGLIKGNTDGTFRPNDTVTYAQFVTMAVRAMGAGPAAEKDGVWPSNVLTFASNNGVTNGAAGAPASPIARGEVAIVAANTVEAPMWQYVGMQNGQPVYEKQENFNRNTTTGATVITKKTLLSEKLNVDVIEDVYVDATAATDPTNLESNQVKFDLVTGKAAGTATTYRLSSALTTDINPLVGAEIKAWILNKEVIRIEVAKANKTETVTFSEVVSTDTVAAGKLVVKVNGKDKTYTYGATPTVTLNLYDNGGNSSSQIATTLGAVQSLIGTAEVTGTIILGSDSKITHLFVTSYDEAIVIDEIKTSATATTTTLYANTDVDGSNNQALVIEDDALLNIKDASGNTLRVQDLKAGMTVVYATSKPASKQLVTAMVLDKKVEGTVEAASVPAKTVRVDGATYEYSELVTLGNRTINRGDEVAIYLDNNNEIVLFERVEASLSSDYGVISTIYSPVDSITNKHTKVLVELTTPDGKTTGLKEFDYKTTRTKVGGALPSDSLFDTNGKFVGEASTPSPTAAEYAVYGSGPSQVPAHVGTNGNATHTLKELLGTIAKYKVSGDKIYFLEYTGVNPGGSSDKIIDATTNTLTPDVDKNTLSFGSTYRVNKNTVILKVKNDTDNKVETDKVEIASWESFKDTSTAGAKVSFANYDATTATVGLVVINEVAGSPIPTGNNGTYGYVKLVSDAGTDKYEILMVVNGIEDSYLVTDSGTTVSSLNPGDVIEFNVLSGKTITNDMTVISNSTATATDAGKLAKVGKLYAVSFKDTVLRIIDSSTVGANVSVNSNTTLTTATNLVYVNKDANWSINDKVKPGTFQDIEVARDLKTGNYNNSTAEEIEVYINNSVDKEVVLIVINTTATPAIVLGTLGTVTAGQTYVAEQPAVAGTWTLSVNTAFVDNETITIAGTELTFKDSPTQATEVATTGTTTNQAAAIVAKLPTVGAYTLTSSGNTITFRQTTPGTGTLPVVSNSSVTGVIGTVTAGTAYSALVPAVPAKWTLQITGLLRTGNTVTVTGTGATATYTVSSADTTLAAQATALATALSTLTAYTIAASGDTVTFTQATPNVGTIPTYTAVLN